MIIKTRKFRFWLFKMDEKNFTQNNKKLRRSGIKRIIQIYLGLLLQAIIFFSAAGHFNIPRAWAYFAICFVHLSLNILIFYKLAPELINQRGEKKEDTKSWDKVFVVVHAPMVFILPAIAGFDVGRFMWSNLGISYAILGLGLYIIAAIITDWAMIENTHFETTVRIQKDRDHQVITEGPYRIVRHPGYVGIILLNISMPFIIGSAYALIPAGIIALLIVIRTSLEDKTLQSELNGYTEYTKKVKYRLLPGVW